MELLVTKEYIDMVRKAGACGDALRSLRVGMPITEVKSEYLDWCEQRFPEITKKLVASLTKSLGIIARQPLSLSLFGSGYGCFGSGDGYGCSMARGSGYGCFGYGDGDGCSGYGYGDGSYGYGYVSGDGDGRATA